MFKLTDYYYRWEIVNIINELGDIVDNSILLTKLGDNYKPVVY